MSAVMPLLEELVLDEDLPESLRQAGSDLLRQIREHTAHAAR
jgi:uncharacterized protein (UPF0147 family)